MNLHRTFCYIAWTFSITIAISISAFAGIAELDVIGWSSDSEYFVFAEYDPGSTGGDKPRPKSSLYIVNSLKNNFDKVFSREGGIDSVKKEAEAHLKKLGFKEKNLGTKLFAFPTATWSQQHGGPHRKSEMKALEFRYKTIKHEMEIEQQKQDGAAKFEIILYAFPPDTPHKKISLQKDKSYFRKCGYSGEKCSDYNIIEAYVSPDGKYIAVIVEAMMPHGENPVVRYLCITGKMPKQP